MVAILGMLVLLVALLAVAGKYVLGRIDDRNSAVAPDPTASYAPVKCTASQVTTALEVKGSTAGQEVTFTVTLTNTSETNPCYLDVGWANMNVTITSGSAYTAATSDCESGSESTILLLDRGMETTRTVSWSGGVGSGCVAPEDNASQPGTYVAEVAFSDSTAPIAQKSFVLN